MALKFLDSLLLSSKIQTHNFLKIYFLITLVRIHISYCKNIDYTHISRKYDSIVLAKSLDERLLTTNGNNENILVSSPFRALEAQKTMLNIDEASSALRRDKTQHLLKFALFCILATGLVVTFFYLTMDKTKNTSKGTVFENHRKSLMQHCERRELRIHFEWTKVH